MDQLPGFGKEISKIVFPTLKAYEPLLQANAEKIRSVAKQSHSYGSHTRQQLDVYSAAKPSIVNGRQPVLVFLYGGGLVQGHKTLPGIADELLYSNLGFFFAHHCGYTTVVVDYRLVFSHDAKFPSGGEDLALAVEWIIDNTGIFGEQPVDLFIMGNSAGGAHVSTFLLHPSFSATRVKILGTGAVRLRGSILLSVPFHFRKATPDRQEVLGTYFDDSESQCPLGLLKAAKERGSIDILEAGAKVLVLNGELDPLEEIMIPRDDFLKEWLSIGTEESRNTLAVDMMSRHNHISPPPSLGTGIEQEEAWGFQVAAFCNDIRKFAAI